LPVDRVTCNFLQPSDIDLTSASALSGDEKLARRANLRSPTTGV
jgi:hypothetical protein